MTATPGKKRIQFWLWKSLEANYKNPCETTQGQYCSCETSLTITQSLMSVYILKREFHLAHIYPFYYFTLFTYLSQLLCEYLC